MQALVTDRAAMRKDSFLPRLPAHEARNTFMLNLGKLEKDLAALKGASLLHIWSSAMGVRALVEGIPVQHHAPHWICGLGHQTREDKLRFMACGQWHHEEIATGEPFARILDNLESVKWA